MGIPATVFYSSNTHYKDIGVKVQIKPADAPTTAKMRVEGNFQTYAGATPTSIDDPDEQLSPYITGNTLNFGRYSNSKVDQLYKQQSKIMDTAKRKEIVYEIQRILMDDMPVVMLAGRVDAAANAVYVRNVVYTPAKHFHFSRSFERVWLDK
jgi:peptide/nickel transport system substrate-binding protein